MRIVLQDTPSEFNPGVTSKLLNDLWESFVLNPLIPKERDILFNWLIMSLDPSKSLAIDIKDLINFY